ncbi:MAG TPA: N,N-dimethylformamidase beta subunit family domain-containing protein, partial [Vicinamibacterales bacterium]
MPYVESRNAIGARAARFVTAVALGLALMLPAAVARAQNSVADENQLPGNPSSEWEVSGSGDPTIQGFATRMSVLAGETIEFKVSTDATLYRIDVYRLGWYGGSGARLVATVTPSATLPQVQPDPLTDGPSGLVDCGNWAVSASWPVPANAVSGLYIARLVRLDTQGASHIAFVVRRAGASDLLFKTSDATWQAYNVWGGNSLYVGNTSFPSGHAAKVSYNRPFSTRAGGGGSGSSEDWLFNAEYPMVRWLERNGYDVAYTTDVDMDLDPTPVTPALHRVLLSVGHDEYWSAAERAKFEAARGAGVHLAFFSGNEVYWKTRWEPSIDVSGTPHRTLVCYKEGTLGENVCGGKCDPLADTWTGLWRDGCAFPAADGCHPENSLSGQISWDGTTTSILVPDTFKNLRFWRNTGVALLGSGATATLAPNSLGYEWDFEQYAEHYPAGRVRLSSTSFNGKTHHLSLYRHASGALVFGAGTVQWSWGLDDQHDRGSDPPNPDMQQATMNLFADMSVLPATGQAELVLPTPSSDAAPPASVIGFPPPGASFPAGAPLVITGTAADAAGAVAGVEISVDGGILWHAATGTTSWSYAWTPEAAGIVTIQSRAVDDLGNLEAPGTSPAPNAVAVTVTDMACPCTIFPASAPSLSGIFNDGQAIELGMRFRASQDGLVTGVRFWKDASMTGTHVGHLWTNDGVAQLAEVTFSGETSSGWQQASFSTPVPVTANVTYVVSVHSPNGSYPATNPFFTTSYPPLPTTAPVRALADDEDGDNGLYRYGASGFPTSNYQSSNYWVDVVYDVPTGPDDTPPTVTATVPGNGATGIAANAAVTASFSEALNPATLGPTTFELRDGASTLVPASVSWNGATLTATLDPAGTLDYTTSYTATLKGGAGGLADVAGNELAADVAWTFTTSAPPPPPATEGPGGPILVVSDAANPFSRYFVEILRAEVLNAFTAMDVTLVTPATLTAYDAVILGEMTLTISQVGMLSDWVDAGGLLVAMRPDAQLAGLLGLTPAGGSLTDKYLLVNTSSGPGAGIVGETIQFHGPADLYTLSGATSLATLYSTASTATANPAVTSHLVGVNGGRAVAFAYDLARSVVYTRQGNPGWVGQERDGTAPIRSVDLFYGNMAGDPQPDWIDLDKVAIPQADEQQRLLANVLLQGTLHRKPMPRFWYLPKGLKAAIVETGDDHGDAGMAPRFDIYNSVTVSPPGCSVEDWECVRATGYLYLGSTFTPAQAAFYDGLGFEVALHINTGCTSPDSATYRATAQSQLEQFSATYPGIPAPVTNRNHCIAWHDWTTVPEVESGLGIRFDTNYYYWPSGWVQNRAGMFTGSGMPMRFAKLDGSIVDCYQAATEMPDESGETFPEFCDSLLARATGPRGYYGVFTTNMHFDFVPHPGSASILASAQARGIPVVSARQMLEWLDGRNASTFGSLAWSGSDLSFTIEVGGGARNLRAMLPVQGAEGLLASLTRGGSPVSFTIETIKGIAYAMFPADAGGYVATYAVDETGPMIAGV